MWSPTDLPTESLEITGDELAKKADDILGSPSSSTAPKEFPEPATQEAGKRAAKMPVGLASKFKKKEGPLNVITSKLPGYAEIDFKLTHKPNDIKYNNIFLKFMVSDDKRSTITQGFFQSAHLENQNKFGCEFNGTEGAFCIQVAHMGQLNKFLEKLNTIGIRITPTGIEKVPIWMGELHLSMDTDMFKGGEKIKGDFISLVIDSESNHFMKFKDTLNYHFPNAMYRSSCFLPTVKGKEAYTWKLTNEEFVERLETFLDKHGIKITGHFSNQD